MQPFLHHWGVSAITSIGFFWVSLWAFCLGYVVSSMIEVFVSKDRMQRAMGVRGPRAVALAAFFGFVSSSCSFAALSTTRALFSKGAGLVPALAFLLSSTNLVIELGILIAVFLSWQFVIGEYIGAVLMIGFMWVIVALTLPPGLEEMARQKAEEADAMKGMSIDMDMGDGNDMQGMDMPDMHTTDAAPPPFRSLAGWRQVAMQYRMEWSMVWKDVTFGFTIAGVIATFVPAAAFQALFVGSSREGGPLWWETVLQTLVGPVAAFFTFIGSMGNIPLAAVLYGSGVSFAGIMAFIFSDLIVFPIVRVSARYFGWKMALYIVAVFLVALVAASICLHYGFAWAGILPDTAGHAAHHTDPASAFAVNVTLFLNAAFLAASGWLVWQSFAGMAGMHHDMGQPGLIERTIGVLAKLSCAWLAIGVVLWFVV
ncbi:MAG: permease [Planctomycetota bacterium]